MNGILRQFCFCWAMMTMGLGIAPAREAGMLLVPEYTVVSPKGAFRIEQFRDKTGGRWQIWVRDLTAKRSYRLDDADKESGGYASEIFFSPDEQRLVRTQKTGSGDNAAMFYGRGKDGRFHDFSWGGDFGRRAWKSFDQAFGFTGKSAERYHAWIKGLGWSADSKSFGLELSARHCGEEYSVYAWRLHFNAETGQFFLSSEDNAFNQKRENGVHWRRNGRFE